MTENTMDATNSLDALDTAELIAWEHGDTETVLRLRRLADEVRTAIPMQAAPLPICPLCGGSVNLAPRVQCQECGRLFSATTPDSRGSS
jgi:hypothetical protein